MNSKTTPFRLPPHVVARVKGNPDPFGFNGLGAFVYKRTYSRIKPDGNHETWPETVERVVNGTYNMQKNHVERLGLGWNEEKGQKSAEEMFNLIYNLRFTPPGRGIWAMGTDITEKKGIFAALNNCAFVSTADIATEQSKPFRFLMDMSMLGVGCGFDVSGAGKCEVKSLRKFKAPVVDNADVEIKVKRNLEKEEIFTHYMDLLNTLCVKSKEKLDKLPADSWERGNYTKDLEMYSSELAWLSDIVKNSDYHSTQTYIIEDTREGWVNATGKLIDSYLLGEYPVVMDYSKIRPAGQPLKTFGGLSSGPDPLIDLHIMIREVFTKNIGLPITERTIVDIMNLIGKCVVAGNVRRCLPKGTLVHTTRGKVPIENLKIGMKVVTMNGARNITHWVNQGQQECVEVKTSEGNFMATRNHRMAVASKLRKSFGFKSIEELTLSDKLVMSHHFNTESGVWSKVDILNIGTKGVMCDTYDISVEGNEYFAIENGIISHNSSELALGPADSEEFIDLKNYALNPDRVSYGWCSNNSIYAKVGMDYSNVAKRIADNGEPGLFWLDNAQKFSRMIDAPDNKDARAIGSNPCAEQTLCSYELCCLCEVYLPKHKTLEEFLRTLKFAYLYAKTVTLGDSHWVETNRVMMRNRRIGCSVTGIVQHEAVHGLNVLKEWLEAGYQEIQKWDRIYSEYFTVPRSVKTTSVKPSGCVTPSTVILASDDPSEEHLLNMTVQGVMEDCGVNFKDHLNSKDTWIKPKRDVWVKSHDGSMQRVSNLYINGVADCLQIPLEDGRTIECTPEHKFLIKGKDGNKWVRADELKQDDDIVEV